MRIVLIRHGETEWNRLHRLQGREDIPLSDVGRAQVTKTAEGLRGIAAEKAIASPLKRAWETGCIVAKAMGIGEAQVITDSRLIERDYGHFSGMDTGDLFRFVNALEGEDVEKEENIPLRMAEALLEQSKGVEGILLAASHGGAITGLLREIMPGMKHVVMNLGNAAVCILTVEDGALKVLAWNLTGEEAGEYLKNHP